MMSNINIDFKYCNRHKQNISKNRGIDCNDCNKTNRKFKLGYDDSHDNLDLTREWFNKKGMDPSKKGANDETL
jgi:hypothetical protein